MKVLEPEKVTPASDVTIGSGELWLPAKELHEVMMEVMREVSPSEQLIQDVDRVLTRHAGDFSSIFALKPPSPVDRDELQKCSTEGRYLKGFRGKQVLPFAIVNEAIMLSDMFHINEFLALDLLTIAENELDNYPNWPRGLVAVHMFYEGRFWLMQSLVTMIRCSPGRQWQSNFHPQILVAFRRILNSVFREDMMDRLVTHLETFGIKKQLDILENNLALGDTRHRRKVKSLLHCIKDSIAFTIFCYSAQRSLRWAELSRILDYLKAQILPEERERPIITKGDTTLIATILYTIETTLNPEDMDMTFGQSLRKYLSDNETNGFKCMEVWDVIKLAFHIAASKLGAGGSDAAAGVGSGSSNRPGPYGDSFATGEKGTPTSRGSARESSAEETQRALLGCDPAEFDFSRNVFGFLQAEIFSRPSYYTWDQDITKVYHGFLVDFIVNMQVKLKDMKYRSEEMAKTILICQDQGINPPMKEVQEYESFLECIGEFYEHDPFELSHCYFIEESQFLPLAKLVRASLVESPALFVSSIRFLTGITSGNPRAIFDMLRQNGHNTSLEHFFESILKYLQTFNMVGLDSQQQLQMALQSAAENKQLPQHSNLVMNPVEISGICSYLRLIETVCERYEPARSFFTSQKPNWIRTVLQVVKIRKVPREIRASMLDACAAMIGEEPLSPEVITILWDMFYAARLIDPGTGDVKEELEGTETRLEEYSLTIGMLRLFKALVKTRFRQMEFVSLEGYFVHPTYDNGAIFPYVNYITDAVFLKAPFRHYKNNKQSWNTIKLCADILSILLDYLPKLMVQLLCDGPLIRTILSSMFDCILASDARSEPEDPIRDKIEQCSLAVLTMLWRALQRQQFYILQKREVMESQEIGLLLGIHKVLMSTSMDNGAPEYVLSLIRFVDTLSYSPGHVKAALEILSIVLEDNTDIDNQIYHALEWHEGIASVFKHMVIELLYQSSCNELGEPESIQDSMKMSALKLLRTSVVHMDPNVGMFLLGFNVKKRDYFGTKTLLHSILENASSIPTSFMTMLTLLCDPRLSQPTLKFLRYSRFFHSYLCETDILQQMTIEGLSYFLKCLAIELKSEEGGMTVASELFPACVRRLEEILNLIRLENHSVELPDLEFFDGGLVMQALAQCEYVDKELRTRLIRVEMLDGMLKDEITKLEKSTVLHLRKTVHTEAKEVLTFAKNLNEARMKEGCKLMVFDGWRQVVEVLALTPQLKSPEFCPTMLRMLLSKVLSTKSVTDFFLRLAAESTLTLCAVMTTQDDAPPLTPAALNVIIHNLCQWLASASNVKVRGILYAALLYCVNMLGAIVSVSGASDAIPAIQNSFPLILDNLCRDCCQGSGETTRMQALYLMGEIIRCTTYRGMAAAASGHKTGMSFMEEVEAGGDFISFSRSHAGGMNKSVDSLGSFDKSFGINKSALTSTRMQPSASPGEGAGELSKNINRLSSSLAWLGQSRLSGGAGAGLSSIAKTSATEGIMNCVYNNGFLSTIVESLCVVDDLDLMALLATDQSDATNVMTMAMRAFFVFEAKLNMLSRLAGSGLKAAIHLIDLNLVKRLTDMKVFELQSYQQQDAGSSESYIPPTGMVKSSEMNVAFTPSPYAISESLYVQVVKMFYVMLDSAPLNVQVLIEILQFCRVHDSSLSKILSQGRILSKDSPRTAPQLLTGLMAKIAGNQQRIRSGIAIFHQKSLLKPALLNILRIQAETNSARGDEIGMRLVKQVMLFLYYSSKPVDLDSGSAISSKKPKHGGNKVITNKLDLDTLLRDQDEDVSMGVVLQCVVHAAKSIVDSQVKEKKKGAVLSASTSSRGLTAQSTSSTVPSIPFGGLTLSEGMMEDLVVVVEVGLSVIYFHLEMFLQEMKIESKQQYLSKGAVDQYTEQVRAAMEGVLSKPVNDACKKIEDPEYIETILLKIRRLTSGGNS